MLKLLILSCVSCAWAQNFNQQQQFNRNQFQQQQPQQQFNGQFNFNQQTTTPTPGPNHPPAQVHYVNIGPELQGDYKFGYDTGKGPSGQSFREEIRLPDGTVKGAYGYVDADGKQRIVRYTAGKEGFKVEGDMAAPDQGPARPAPAQRPVQRQQAPTPAQAPQQPRFNPAPQQQSHQQIPPQHHRQFIQAAPQQQQQQQQQFRQPQPQPQPQPQQQQQQFRQPQQQFAQPSLRQINRVSTNQQQEENFGPAVIDTSLLSYNIGTG